jgi:hypothetical protein
VSLGFDGVLTICRSLPEDEIPEPPIRIHRQAFAADNQTMGDADTLRLVMAMQPGREMTIPAADGELGHPCITTLMPVQAWFLREAEQLGGVVGFAGVGAGKSVCFLLSPLLFPDSRLAVLLIEPKQRQHYRSQYLRLREHFRVSSIVCDVAVPGGTVAGTVPVHLISYSVLSRTTNSDLLDRLLPDVVLLDEAHRACGTSAINRRIKRYVASRIRAREDAMARGEPVRARAVRMLDGSGTLEVKSINDTQMLCTFSLGLGSPLPIDPNEAAAWSNVVDDSYQPDRTSSIAKSLHKVFGRGIVEDRISFGGTDHGDTELRKGFQRWRAATPGIVTAAVSNVNAAIYFGEYPVPKMPPEVRDALMKVRVEWLRPDGDEFVEKMAQLACAKSVACGFYPYWAFPSHPCTCVGGAVDDDRCDQCLLIEEWYAKRKLFNKELRARLIKGEVQLDSQKLCEDAADRALDDPPAVLDTYCDTCWKTDKRCVYWPCEEMGHKPGWRSVSWADWKDIENQVQYEEKVRWIGHNLPEAEDPNTHPGYFLARDLAKWALKNKGIVWFQSIALGRKIAELSGLPYFNGGPGGEDRLRAEKGNRSIIVSIPAHGAGTDGLQHLFNDQVIAEMPASNASARGIEQVLGRLHRPGQKKDEVNTLACLHVVEMKYALRKAIQQAEFNFNMTGNRQKILIADMDVDEL